MTQNTPTTLPFFLPFSEAIDHIALPEQFNFPFYYEPHELCLLAAKEVQQHLENQTEWDHNFGLNPDKEGYKIGKMFGVLVVRNTTGEIGYLAAFSGKLANENHHAKFVPPIFDMLTEGSFLNVGMDVLNEYNAQIKTLEEAPDYVALKAEAKKDTTYFTNLIKETKKQLKEGKAARKVRREAAKKALSADDYLILEKELVEESLRGQLDFKGLTIYWKKKQAEHEEKLGKYLAVINDLKQKRKQKSAGLQRQIFEEYQFLNINGDRKNLLDIFGDITPPAGAGECAAPKLLQYAFLHQLEPIAMAEFWWGTPPPSAVRKHQHFYPACWGKCKPILGHMLEGMNVEKNPFAVGAAKDKNITTVFEDEHLVVINKPPELLSVPGKLVEDSVATRMKLKYPEATGPLVVHRLDMSTSGLLLVAKTEAAHKFLQYQFIKRHIKKRYVALLDGLLEADEGTIDLPLRVDLDDRPRQLVCYEHGKKAKTEWKVIERTETQTRVHFFPITGRTHQLRVHAAHPSGLNTPIVGDDLYGLRANRLHLHAERIEFRHPETKEMMVVSVEAEF